MDLRVQQARQALIRREGQFQSAQADLEHSNTELKKHEQSMAVLAMSREVLTKIAQLKREETTSKIEQLVSKGLQAVLGDESVALKVIEHTTAKRITYKFALDGRGFSSEDIRNEKGGGVQNLVSFLLTVVLTMMLDKDQSRVFLLDEKFAHLSREYLPATGKLINELSEKLGVQFVEVTHQPELVDCADAVYKFSQNSSGITSAKRVQT